MSADEGGWIKVREGAVAWQEIDGEAILLDIDTSTYLGLNGSAAVLWPQIMTGTSRSDLVALLRQRYELPDEQATADVDKFIAMCTQRNLLEQ